MIVHFLKSLRKKKKMLLKSKTKGQLGVINTSIMSEKKKKITKGNKHLPIKQEKPINRYLLLIPPQTSTAQNFRTEKLK